MSTKPLFIAPILMGHDHSRLIGSIQLVDGRLMAEFSVGMDITKELLFDIFGGAGISTHHIGPSGKGDGYHVFRGQILEFSLCAAPPARATP